MIGASAAYMSGLFFASFFTDIAAVLVFLLAGTAVVIFGKRARFKFVDYSIIICSFISAFVISLIYTGISYNKIISYDGKSGSFSGVVTDIDVYSGDSARYVLKGKINGEQNAKVIFYDNNADLQYGDIITIGKCNYTVPSSDYLFDSESYYKSEGIFLSVSTAKEINRLHTYSNRFKNKLMTYREKMISEFRIELGSQYGNFLAGMVFGEKQGLDNNTKTMLYRTGIGHVLAVSGLHVSIIALIIMKLLESVNINRYISFFIVNSVLTILVIMANSPISALRAMIMMNFLWSAHLFRRQNDTLNSLAGAVLLICIANPYAIYNSGFLMSSSGTFGIGVLGPYLAKAIPSDIPFRKLLKNFVIMSGASISVFPLSMRYFEETSLISPITNVFLVPLCSVAMFIGLIYVLTGGMISLLEIAWIIIKFVFIASERLSDLSFTHFPCGSYILFILTICLTGIISLTYIVFNKRRYTVYSIFVSIFVFVTCSSIYRSIRFNTCTVAVLGRSSNAAVVVTCKGKTNIIDLSGHYRSSEYVRKYVLENGISNADLTILTTNVQSQYSVYAHDLELIEVGKWLVSGDTYIYGADDITVIGENEVTVDNGIYKLNYIDGMLEIDYCGNHVSFLSAQTGEGEGMCIYYGNTTKNSLIRKDLSAVYLDKKEDNSINNFELVLSENNTYILRRL